MRKQVTVLTIFVLTAWAYSCNQSKQADNSNSDSVTKGNVSTTISEDTQKLARLLDFGVYRPSSVKFKYVLIDNSGQSERLSIPGPSDYILEAVLFYDSLTFKNFQTSYFYADYVSPHFTKEEFDFDWLDKDIKEELMQSDSTYHGHPNFFLGTNKTVKLWLLNKKVLLLKSTT